MTWSFEPRPFPPHFPLLHPVEACDALAGQADGRGTRGSSCSSDSLQPRGLTFFLSQDHPSLPVASCSYTLLVCSCNLQAVPLKV